MAESISSRVAWKLRKVISGGSMDAPSRTGTATVQRRDADGTVWVRFPGSSIDTPVTGAVVANVAAGDTISYDLSGGRVSVTGNASDPAAGTSTVRAVRKAAESAAKVASGTQAIADAIKQHFWADDNGAHVSTEKDDPTGERNILMNSLGILLRQGSTWLASFSDSAVAFYDGLGNAAANVVAQFGADGAVIGRSSESHMELDYHSMQLVSQSGNSGVTYFHVSDLRERNGTFSRTDTLDVDITVPISSFDLAIPASEITSVKFGYSGEEEDVDPSGYSVHRSSTAPYDGYITSLTFSPPLSLIDGEPDPDALYPAVMVSLVVSYVSDIPARVLTFGSRTGNVGPYSSALGQYNVASGHTSHARGLSCVASGKYSCADGEEAKAEGQTSHAFGRDVRATGRSSFAEGESTVAEGYQSHAQNYGTMASAAAQTAIGMFNVRDDGVGDDIVTDTFTGDGTTRVFTPSQYVAYTMGVYINGTLTDAYSRTSDYKSFQFTTAPASGATVKIEYITTTLPVGYPGYGRYAFMVGNGADPSRRSNAFAVQWDGVTTHYGDIPWTTFPVSSAASHYNSSKPLRYRKWGQMVNLMGAVKPNADVPAGQSYSLNIGTLPEGCRPQDEVTQLCQGSGTASWMLRITTGGVVTAERYRTGSGYAIMPAPSGGSSGAWLTMNCTFIV